MAVGGMNGRGISADGLRGIACVTMLADHIGAVLIESNVLRSIGRVSFPIFCYLLVQGTMHTRDVRRYALRLLAVAVLSEGVYDILFYGAFTLAHQNVIFTLLIGLGMLEMARRWNSRVIALVCAVVLAEGLQSDYGGLGIALIALFAWTKGIPHARLWQALGMVAIFLVMPSSHIRVFQMRVPIQLFGALALVPIAFCNGTRRYSNLARWGAYLFYPLHLLVLLGVRCVGIGGAV